MIALLFSSYAYSAYDNGRIVGYWFGPGYSYVPTPERTIAAALEKEFNGFNADLAPKIGYVPLCSWSIVSETSTSPSYCASWSLPSPCTLPKGEAIWYDTTKGCVGPIFALGTPRPYRCGENAPPDPYGFDAECTLPDPDKDQCPVVGNPIVVGSGIKFDVSIDYSGGTDALRFVRVYRSKRVSTGAHGIAVGQFTNYHKRLILSQVGTQLYAYREDGRVYVFTISGGSIIGDADIADRVTRTTNSGGAQTGWNYYDASSESIEQYDLSGYLLSVTDRSGRAVRLTYNDSFGNPHPNGAPLCKVSASSLIVNGNGKPLCVTDTFGRQINFGS